MPYKAPCTYSINIKVASVQDKIKFLIFRGPQGSKNPFPGRVHPWGSEAANQNAFKRRSHLPAVDANAANQIRRQSMEPPR